MSESFTPSGGSTSYNFTGNPSDVVVNGSSTTSLTFIGGSGNATVFGGTNATLFGGSGNSVLVGGTNVFAVAGSGNATIVAGTGASTIDGSTGGGSEAFYTNPNGSASTQINLNNAADTVIGGSGQSTVFSGTGSDVFGFVNGHAGGSEIIYGFNASSTLVFGGYGATPIASESVVNGSDTITLTDQTTITLAGIDHLVFNGIGTEK